MKFLIAGIVGGIIVFVWGYVSHTVLPLGKAAIKTLPGETALLSTLSNSLSEPGVYLFPAEGAEGDESAMESWKAKYTSGPRGTLAWDPQPGLEPQGWKQLGAELASNVLAALLAAILVSWTRGPYLGRVLFVGLLGVFGWLSISVSHWNWYRFPTDFTLAEGIGEAAGWLIAGIVIARLVKPAQP